MSSPSDKNAFLTNINPEIQKTLEARQSRDSRSQSAWFKNRTPWIRLSSMVKVGGDENIRKQNILYAGTSSITSDNKVVLKQDVKSIYANELNRPMPGITKLHVENKSSFGSVREATISFSCWTIDQLETMEKLYMSLGMPLLVEWGWSVDLDGNMVSENLALEEPRNISFYCIDKKIKERVTFWKGHYDAMIGLVIDFNWSFTENGGFDCTTTIISPGDLYLSMSTKTASKGLTQLNDGKKNPTPGTGDLKAENLEAAISNLVKSFNQIEVNIGKSVQNNKSTGYGPAKTG